MHRRKLQLHRRKLQLHRRKLQLHRRKLQLHRRKLQLQRSLFYKVLYVFSKFCNIVLNLPYLHPANTCLKEPV
jgi:hypothetical protein